MTKTQFINEISIGDQVDAPFVILDKRMMEFSSQKRAGEKFMLLRLGDVTGEIKGVLWEGAEKVQELLEAEEIIWIKGKAQEYKGPQIQVDELIPVEKENLDLRSFVPSSDKEESVLKKLLKDKITKITDPQIIKLIEGILLEQNIFNLFVRAPGGKKVHHNYLGGLAEHTLEVIQFCEQMAYVYPDHLNKDLLYAGAILHDIGKIYEYDLNSLSFKFTDKGKLLGHITLGEELLMKHLKKYKSFSEGVALELRHMLLSHHGEKEWGSPEVPKTFNAYCLFYADLLSSRLAQVDKLLTNHQESSQELWTDYYPLLKRAFYTGQNDADDDNTQLTFDI